MTQDSKLKQVKEVKLLFILAIGRSGTTLLQSIINAHSACIVPMETLMVPHLFHKYKNINSWNSRVAEEFVSDLSLEYQYQRHWNQDDSRQERLLDTLRSIKGVPSFEDLIKLILLNESENPDDIKWVGIKTPRHSLLLNMLMEAFPNASYIHLIRDPRASIASHIKSLDYFNLPLLAVKWSIDNELIQALKTNTPSHYHYLKYEDLVLKPDSEVNQLCRFLGINYDPEMLRFYEEVQNQRDQGHPFLKHDHHANLVKPLSSSSMSKWERELSPGQVKLIESYCKKVMVENGYKPKATDTKMKNTGIWYFVYFLWRNGLRTYFRMPLNIRIWLLNLRLNRAGLEPLRRNLTTKP